jgi:hypothetical protein
MAKQAPIRNVDDLQEAIRQDELQDAHEQAHQGVTKMSVREYAAYKKIKDPQLLYYYIRRGYIKTEVCICGRKVIDVASADSFLAEKTAKERAQR